MDQHDIPLVRKIVLFIFGPIIRSILVKKSPFIHRTVGKDGLEEVSKSVSKN